MAKLKVEMDIDWINEDCTLDEEISNRIKDEIIDKIEDTVIYNISETAREVAERRIGLWVNNYIEKLVKEKKIPYKENSYSDEIQMVTIEEIFCKRFEKALTEKVDRHGNTTSNPYDTFSTRLQWIANKYADEKVKELTKSIRSDIEKYTSQKIKEEMLKQLTAQLTGNIDFNKIFKED